MGTIKSSVETARTQLGAGTEMDSLGSGTYVVLGTITHTTNDPQACLLEVAVTPGTVSGAKQVSLFCQASLDGTNFESGPTSGTTTTDEGNLRYIGSIPCNTNSTLQRGVFTLASAYPDGELPYASKIIAKNETGAALASDGNDAYYAEKWGVTA